MFTASTTDRVSLNPTHREYTDEGFLRVPGRAARTGVQEYVARELGLTDRAPDDIVKVMRPPEEVFASDSLASFAGADITVEHPNKMVDAYSFKSVSVGTVAGNATRDGDFVVVDMIIKDADGIKTAEAGKVQLSVGYTAQYDSNVPDGAGYEFIQRDIRVNHIALVDRARAGAQARLFDSHKTGTGKMPIKVTLDTGRSVEVTDEATATLIADSFERLNQKVNDEAERADKAEAERDAKDEELEEAKKESSDAAISSRVATLTQVMDDARTLAGKDFTCDSVNVLEIQRAALSIKKPNTKWADKADAYVAASFDVGVDAEKESEDEDGDDDKAKAANDSYRGLAQDAAKSGAAAPINPRDRHINTVDGAWRKTVEA